MKKSMSYSLVSSLLVLSCVLINCQKAPDKRGVKGVNKGDNSKTTNPAANEKMPTKVCAPEIITSVDALKKELLDLNAKIDARNKLTDKTQKDTATTALKELRVSAVEKCDAISKSLENFKDDDKSCLRAEAKTDADRKNVKNVIRYSSMHNNCVDTAAQLKAENGVETEFAKLEKNNTANRGAKTESAEDARRVDFRKAELVISDDAKFMLSPSNIQWKSYIVDGVVKKDMKSYDEDIKAKKPMCTFLKDDAVNDQETAFMSIETETAAEKGDLPEEVKNSPGTALSVRIHKSEVKADGNMISLLCINLDVKKYTVKNLKDIFGDHFKVASNVEKEEAKKDVEGKKTAAAARENENLAKKAEAAKTTVKAKSPAEQVAAETNARVEATRAADAAKGKTAAELEAEAKAKAAQEKADADAKALVDAEAKAKALEAANKQKETLTANKAVEADKESEVAEKLAAIDAQTAKDTAKVDEAVSQKGLVATVVDKVKSFFRSDSEKAADAKAEAAKKAELEATMTP